MKLLIEHANLTVPSIDEATKFLGTAFPDFNVRGRGHLHGDASRGEWVHFGNDESYLALQQNGEPSGRSDRAYTNDGINHLGFVVEDMQDLLQRMASAGYEPTAASALEGHPYRQRAYFFDKNGFEDKRLRAIGFESAEIFAQRIEAAFTANL